MAATVTRDDVLRAAEAIRGRVHRTPTLGASSLGDVVLKAELPGIKPEDVEIRVEDGTLYLKGERKFEKEVKEESYHHIERSYGNFVRSFPLPNSVNADEAKAEYKDGVLTLTMPKREEAKPKSIKILATKN